MRMQRSVYLEERGKEEARQHGGRGPLYERGQTGEISHGDRRWKRGTLTWCFLRSRHSQGYWYPAACINGILSEVPRLPSHSPMPRPHYWLWTGAWDAPFRRDDQLVCNFGAANFSSVELAC